jgi:hypothetical protein
MQCEMHCKTQCEMQCEMQCKTQCEMQCETQCETQCELQCETEREMPEGGVFKCSQNMGPLIGNYQTVFRMVGSIAVGIDCCQ